LRVRLKQLRSLISRENGVGDAQAEKYLAEFVKLNPHTPDYAAALKDLLRNIGTNSSLVDNILLAEVMLIADEQLRAEKLAELHQKFQNTDAGSQALYELGRLKIAQWQQSEAKSEQKKKYLTEARETLTRFIKLYPNSFYTEQVKENLENLPKED
jgi:outer membrane protein assembly factor BamD (BamD/ComL family)